MYQPPAPAIIQPPAPTASAMAKAATLTHRPFLAAGFGAADAAVSRVAGASTRRGGIGAVVMWGGAAGRVAAADAGAGAAEATPGRGKKTVGANVAGNAATHSMQYLANGRLSVPQPGHVVAIRPALAGRSLRPGR